jgi:putative membrane protein
MSMFFGGWMFIGPAIIIGLIVWAVVAVSRREGPPAAGEKRTPLDIAKERYARGEITRDEFERLRKDLM